MRDVVNNFLSILSAVYKRQKFCMMVHAKCVKATVMIPDAPIPNYQSRRLVGLELEYDAGSSRFPDLNIPPGWQKKADGSLRNGHEFVLEPALPLVEAKASIERFCAVFDGTGLGLTSKGGFHVHVQAHDVSHDAAFILAKLYTHFQPVINQLVAPSRVDNRYCMPLSGSITRSELVDLFRLNDLVDSRTWARSSRVTKTINFAMLRCRTAQHRSLEYRQGSSSKRFECVWGWTSFVVAMTDIAVAMEFSGRPGLVESIRSMPVTLEKLASLIKEHELDSARLELDGQNSVSQWVLWRHKYLNQDPTLDQTNKFYELMSDGRPRGLFTVSKVLDVHLGVAKKLVEAGQRNGRLVKVAGTKPQWIFPSGNDLERLKAAAHDREFPRVANEIARPPGPAVPA